MNDAPNGHDIRKPGPGTARLAEELTSEQLPGAGTARIAEELPLEQLPGAGQRKWMERHVVLVIVLLVSFIGLMLVMCAGGIVALVFHMLRSNAAYTMAMARLNQEPAIMQRLGEPIEPGWLMTGSVSVSGGSGDAKMQIPLKGAKENAQVFIEAIKRDGQWELTYLAVQFAKDPEGQRVIVIAPVYRRP